MDAAVNVVGPLLTEMQYTSTAKPLAAKVSQRDGDRYVVQVFVDMSSRSRQTPTVSPRRRATPSPSGVPVTGRSPMWAEWAPACRAAIPQHRYPRPVADGAIGGEIVQIRKRHRSDR